MSVAKITNINLNLKESADAIVQSYITNVSSRFSETKKLLQIKVNDTMAMAISLYKNDEVIDRASSEWTNEWT